MDSRSDLRVYIDVLRRNWRWVAVAALVAVGVALVVSLALPAKYQATATVLITNPLAEFQLLSERPAASTGITPLSGKAAVELASTDGILQQVLSTVRTNLPTNRRDLYSLRRMLSASTGRDATVIQLKATARDAKTAAYVANVWADLYVSQVNEMHGKSPDQSNFYAAQLAQAETDMQQVEQALVNFQKDSELAVLEAQLAAKQKALSDYLKMDETLVLLEQDVESLQRQLADRPANSQLSLGDELAQLILQVSVLSAQSANLPVQLQLSTEQSLSESRPEEQAAYLAKLSNIIQLRRAEAQEQTSELLPEIKTLQGQIEEISAQANRLTRERDLAQEVYAALALKARETSISAQSGSGSVRLVSSAAAPDRPTNKRLVRDGAIALLLGLVGGIGLAFLAEFLRPSTANVFKRRTEPEPVLATGE